MTVGSFGSYLFLVRNFRNWYVLIQTLRKGGYLEGGPVRERLVFWNGRRVVHPPNRSGLTAILLEIWHRNVYRLGDFYQPQAGDVIVDVGAHVGLFTLRLLCSALPCRVVAIEPSPENFGCLRRNLQEFLCTRKAEIHNLAIGPDFGKIKMLEIPSNRSFDARTTLAEQSEPGAVDAVPLSRVLELAGAAEVQLLKMDAEGGEQGAFAAAEPQLLQRFQRIAMEYHDHLAPGTLPMLMRRLSPTHELTIIPDSCLIHGHLFAVRKDLVAQRHLKLRSAGNNHYVPALGRCQSTPTDKPGGLGTPRHVRRFCVET